MIHCPDPQHLARQTLKVMRDYRQLSIKEVIVRG
jgi:hypothetical protein